jgi:uracil phosphoribosyltransferase
MMQAAWSHFPMAQMALLGIARNEASLKPVQTYERDFDVIPKHAMVLDPMCATGGTASAAVKRVKSWGVEKVTYVCIFAARQGVIKLRTDHPDVPMYIASMGTGLNSKGYIENGCNDAGDRVLGT